jgi:methyl-accepting chemotaxis protein
MIRKRTLGVKLGVAFGVLLLIFAAVGLASWKAMSDARRTARTLTDESIPEMVAATSVQRLAQESIFEIRGYAHTLDNIYLVEGERHLEQLGEALDAAEKLGNTYASLQDLREGAKQARASWNLYKQILGETKKVVAAIESSRQEGEKAQEIFFSNTQSYLNSQKRLLQGYARGSDSLQEVLRIVEDTEKMNRVLDLGNEILIGNFKGQAFRTMSYIETSLEMFGDMEKLLKEMAETTPSPEQLREIEAIQKAAASYRQVIQDTLKNRKLLETLEARRIVAAEKVLAEAQKVASAAEKNAAAAAEEAARNLGTTISLLFFSMLFAILTGAIIAFGMTRSITVPLTATVSLLSRLAEGKLEQKVPEKFLARKDEIGTLAGGVQELTESLRSQIQAIKSIVGTLASSAYQISASVSQITAGAQEASVAVVETTATMEEVRTTAETNNRKSTSVAQIARQGLEVVENGKNATERLLTGMEHIGERMSSIAETIVRLSEQSQEVGEITGTVEDLAEQSNLLAVNAAVEAAKAGEYGRGFSVVAQEIKSLAEQSKESAKEVQRILKDIQKATGAAVMAIEQGSKAVDQGARDAIPSRESIQKITQQFMESAQTAAEIAAANNELFTGIDQVAQAMENIKVAGEQNLAGLKDLESASSNLKDLGKDLAGLINRYTL